MNGFLWGLVAIVGPAALFMLYTLIFGLASDRFRD